MYFLFQELSSVLPHSSFCNSYLLYNFAKLGMFISCSITCCVVACSKRGTPPSSSRSSPLHSLGCLIAEFVIIQICLAHKNLIFLLRPQSHCFCSPRSNFILEISVPSLTNTILEEYSNIFSTLGFKSRSISVIILVISAGCTQFIQQCLNICFIHFL